MTKTKEDLTFAESRKLLQDELATGKDQPKAPTVLPIGQYRFADRVFQPRTFEGDTGASEEHKKDLYEALLRGDTLPPILVWWGGRHWYVIDGHHRAIAYNRVHDAWGKGQLKGTEAPLCLYGVAVEVFSGSLNAAIVKAAELNSRTKLPMTKGDKLERAWKLVVLEDEELSKSMIARATGIAGRTVATMRSTLAALKTENPELNPEDLTWEEARKGNKDAPKDDQWEQRQATKWAKAMGRAFGQQPGRLPHVFALAIEKYAETLPPKLVESWWDHVQDKMGEGDRYEF